MDKSESGEGVKSTVSLSRKMSKVGLLAAMKTFTKPHFQRKKKTKEKAVSRSWDSGLCNVGLTPSPSGGQGGLGTVGSYKRIYWPEPNKDSKTEHSNGNGSVPGNEVVHHSPKGSSFLPSPSSAPPGSVALPGLTREPREQNGVSVTVSNGGSYRNQSHFSPDSAPVSPPTPVPPPAPGPHHHRPASLPKGSSSSATSGKSSSSSGGGKRTRWLLCYHMGGGPPSASPSPPSEHAPHSQCSTPSPTDHGFKLPNSFSNERPTSLPVALLNCSAGNSADSSSRCQQQQQVTEAVNPLSIDPNERVTPSGHTQHNGDLHESLGVTEIGVIPPPPMFSSPSPPIRHILPPPKEHSQHQATGVTTARGHDLSDHQFAKDNHTMYSDEEEEDEEEEEEAEEGFAEVPTRVVTTVPAKEPRLDQQPIKSALKKARGAKNGGSTPPSAQNGRRHASSPAQEKHQASSLGGARRHGGQFSNLREDKENIPHEEEDEEDGPILYRDDDNMEDEDRLAAKLARKESLSTKLEQRPGRQELIDRNILYQVTEEERKIDRSIISAKLIRRLSLRPTPEELEERNVLKRKDDDQARLDREEKKRYLLRKLSFRPSVDELKTRKIIKFNDYIEVTPCHEYDRRADKPWTRLTPKDKANIRKELNDYKSAEMDVHDDSRHLTRFHRP